MITPQQMKERGWVPLKALYEPTTKDPLFSSVEVQRICEFSQSKHKMLEVIKDILGWFGEFFSNKTKPLNLYMQALALEGYDLETNEALIQISKISVKALRRTFFYFMEEYPCLFKDAIEREFRCYLTNTVEREFKKNGRLQAIKKHHELTRKGYSAAQEFVKLFEEGV